MKNVVADIKCLNVTNVRDCRRANLFRGQIWEAFCKRYLEFRGYDDVRPFGDVCVEDKKELGLGTTDMGIDLICRKEGRYCAVQCKFRSKRTLSWTEIATFEALCARTGPWREHILMTNCCHVRRVGSSEKDITMTQATFKAIPRHAWLQIGGMGTGNVLNAAHNPEPKAIRDRWLARLEQDNQHPR